MSSVYETEIVELHHFFQQWFNGTLPQTDEAFQRMLQVMDESFVIIMPNGTRIPRDPLLDGLYKANGGRPGIRIWVENVQLLFKEGPLAVVEYEEWQEEESKTSARVSTGVYRDAPNTPNGITWLRVHETWFETEDKNWFNKQQADEET